MSKYFIFFNLLFVIALSAQSTGDFLIVENPRELVILNKFKQPINNSEKGVFAKNKPLLVTKHEGLLNDGVRGYTEVEINNNKFYILKEIKGKYYGEQNVGVIQKYLNKRYYYDTLKIISSSGNILYNVNKKDKKILNEGELIVRVFEDRNLIYVKLSDNSYGWLQLGKIDVDFTLIKTGRKSSVHFSKSIISKIKEKFEYANKINERIFSELNKIKDKKITAPRWKVVVTKKMISATLDKEFEKFNESNKLLVNKLETVVIGTGLKVRLNKNNIEITE